MFNQTINILLRHYGKSVRHGLDHEQLELYSEGRFTVYKLTSDFDGRSVFVITQDRKDVYVSGDAYNQRHISGEWEQWLQQKVIAIPLNSSSMALSY